MISPTSSIALLRKVGSALPRRTALAGAVILFACRDPHPANEPAKAKPDPIIEALVAHSGDTPPHHCQGDTSGYAHCGERHTFWAPPQGSPLRKLGDSVYSRILAEKAAKDGSRVVFIENAPPDFGCQACSPILSAVVWRTGRDRPELFQDLGDFGSNGSISGDIGLVSDASGTLYARGEWNEAGQGYGERGIWIASLARPSRKYVIQLGGDNAGACADGTEGLKDEPPCYAFEYRIENGEGPLPDTLKLKGSGNRPGDSGNLQPVGDTAIALR